MQRDVVNSEPCWEFGEIPLNQPNEDPIAGEYFKAEALENAAAALVRESYQNSMDAKDDAVVEIRVYFSSEGDKLGNEEYREFFAGLEEHIAYENNGLYNRPELGESMGFIVIEDYGTKGLSGDIEIIQDSKIDDSYQNFYYFWRNIGRSGKSGSDAGRWGLGKTVFAASSRINTFFGLTVRKDDGRELLMGQSTLKTRFINGTRFAPYGYYAINKNGFPPMPIEDKVLLKQFSERFCLKRQGRPGLSIVIPFPFKDITPQKITTYALKHYFFPILQGRLKVRIESCDLKYTLDQNNITEEIKNTQLFESDEERLQLLAMVELAEWSITLPALQYHEVKKPGAYGSAPKWRRDLFKDNQLELLKREFDENKPIGLMVPLAVRSNEGEEFNSYFKVFIQRERSTGKGWSQYIRSGITISGMRGLESRRGVMGFVLIDDKFLSELLGNSENPAHTFWNPKSESLTYYDKGPSVIWFVRDSLVRLVDIFSESGTGEQPDLLRDIFSVDLPEAPLIPGGDKETSKGKKGEPDFPGIESKIQPFKLERIASGFYVRNNPESSRNPSSMKVLIAYELRRGNPFSKYDPLDFDVSKDPITIAAKGIQITKNNNNEIEGMILSPQFDLSVTGFDPSRDLRIWVNAEMEGSGD